MKRRLFVVSFAEFERLLSHQIQALSSMGVDTKGLIYYSLHLATESYYPNPPADYNTLRQYLIHDLHEAGVEIRSSLLHTCIDFVGEASRLIVPFLSSILGGFDGSVRLVQFTAGDAVLSVDVSE
jgi:hypothetical protein